MSKSSGKPGVETGDIIRNCDEWSFEGWIIPLLPLAKWLIMNFMAALDSSDRHNVLVLVSTVNRWSKKNEESHTIVVTITAAVAVKKFQAGLNATYSILIAIDSS